jgi:predicted nucleotidyltransferase
MKLNKQILSSIKEIVLESIPGAQVLLFGSRAKNISTKESDWDILVLTQEKVSKELKKQLHERVFPLSVQIGSFINLLVVQEKEWVNNPSYYSLRQNIFSESIPA